MCINKLKRLLSIGLGEQALVNFSKVYFAITKIVQAAHIIAVGQAKKRIEALIPRHVFIVMAKMPFAH